MIIIMNLYLYHNLIFILNYFMFNLINRFIKLIIIKIIINLLINLIIFIFHLFLIIKIM